jgi:hypothetical protein
MVPSRGRGLTSADRVDHAPIAAALGVDDD